MGFLKLRNFLIIIALTYAATAIILVVSELTNIQRATNKMTSTIALAADAALNQVVASDEFFNDQEPAPTTDGGKSRLYAVKGVSTVLVSDLNQKKCISAKPSTTIGLNTVEQNYQAKNIFALCYAKGGWNAKIEELAGQVGNAEAYKYYKENYSEVDKEKLVLYTRMYGGAWSPLRDENWFNKALEIKSEVNGVSLPTIYRMGLLQGYNGKGNKCEVTVGGKNIGTAILTHGQADKLYGMLDEELHIVSASEYVSKGYNGYNEESDWYRIFQLAKPLDTTDENSEHYFLAPTNIGITYIDPFLLETAFVSNMDLIMRATSIETAGSENYAKVRGGLGIPPAVAEGDMYQLNSDAINSIVANNIITDGFFSFVKGNLLCYSDTAPGGWSGGKIEDRPEGKNRVLPKITYKLLNLNTTDLEEQRILRLVLGFTGDYDSFKDRIGIEGTEPKYIMVARITFYADTMISYQTPLVMEYYNLIEKAIIDKREQNLYTDNKLVQSGNILTGSQAFYQVPVHALNEAGTGRVGTVSAITGNDLYEYTTYFAVIP